MNIAKALYTAKEWNRRTINGPLYKFIFNKTIVDIEHRRELIVRICYEMWWLQKVGLKDDRSRYSQQDVIDLNNLLTVVQNMEYGEI